MQIAISTKNALQASLAVFLTLVLYRVFNLTFAYWATLTTFLLISQTFGDSIKKSVERVAMTAFGCFIGYFIYFGIKDSFLACIILIVVAVAFINYYLLVANAVANFIIALFVVFIFTAFGRWDATIFEARVVETAIGAGVAILSVAIVFPISTKKTIMSEFSDFTTQLQQTSDDCFTVLFESTASPEPSPIVKTFDALQTKVHNLRNEQLFSIYSGSEFNYLLTELQSLAASITQAFEIAKDIKAHVSFTSLKPEFLEMKKFLNNNLETLKCQLSNTPCDKQYMNVDPIKKKIHLRIVSSLKQSVTNPDDWFKVMSLLYSMRKANENIKNILEIVDDKYSEK